MSQKFLSLMALVAVACGSAGQTPANNEPGTEPGHSGSSGAPSSSSSGGAAAPPDDGAVSSDDGAVPSDDGAVSNDDSGPSEIGTDGASPARAVDAAVPPHVVLPCPTGDAGAKVGVWENVTPPGVSLSSSFNTPAGQNYGIHAFVIDPTNTANVYVGTSAQGIYKTTDCGATWVKINTGTGGSTVGSGRNGSMVIDSMNPKVLYTDARYGPLGLFKSTDGGVSWTQIMVTNITYIESIAMDPTNDQHIAVTPHFTCNDKSNCIMESTNGGSSWTMLSGAPAAGELGGLIMLSPTTWLEANMSSGLQRTTNGGGSWTQVHSSGTTYPFLYQDSAGTYLLPNTQGIMSSTDTITWTGIKNSPASISLAGGDSKIFAANQNNFSANAQYYAYAAVSAQTTWTNIMNPSMTEGGWQIHYDADHHILYSANFTGGFWRIRLQ